MGSNGFEITVRRLFDVARLAAGDDQIAEEAVRAAVWDGHLARGRVPPGPRAAVWLFGATRVELMDRIEADRDLPHDVPVDPDEPLDAIAAHLWRATRSLPPLDRVVLALHLRSGLSLDDLALALGVGPRRAYRLTTRARTRAVGVLLPLVPTGTSPLAVLSDIDPAPLPPGLETAALLVPSPEPELPPKLDRRGFPGPRIVPRVRAEAVALAAAALLVVTAFAIAVNADRGGADAGRSAAEPSPLGVSTQTTRGPTTATTGAPLGALTVSTPSIDLGVDGTSAGFDLINGGAASLAWTATADTESLVVLPTNGALEPGDSARIEVTLIRAQAAEGEFRHGVNLVAAEAGTGSVLVTATIEHPPVISGTDVDPDSLVDGDCDGSQEATVAITASDESGVAGVALAWEQADGQSSASTLEVGDDNLWYGTIGPVTRPGDVVWSVTAVDTRGNRATLEDQFLPVSPCPD